MTDNQTIDESQSKKKTLRKRLFGIAQVVVSVALLAWLLNRVGLREIGQQFAGMNIWLYVSAILVFLVSVWIRALRWKMVLTPLKTDAPIWYLTRLYLLGFFWNSFLPTGFGGDVVKAVALARDSKQATEAATSVIAERVIGLLGTCLIAIVVLLFYPRIISFEWFLLTIAICAGIILGGWFLRLDLLEWTDQHIPFLRRIVRHEKVISLHEAIRAYDMRTIALTTLISVPFTFLFIITNYLIGLSLGVFIAPRYYAIFTPVVSVVNLLPLSFNGLGVREYMYNLLFVPVGVSAEKAISMALAFNFMRIITGVIGGLLSLITGMSSMLRPASLPTVDVDSPPPTS